MKNWSRFAITILAGLFLFINAGCPKEVEQNELGPGGLPKGIVTSEPAPLEDSDFPVFPGAEKRANNVYQTDADLSEVVEWYATNLQLHPETRGEEGDIRAFITEAYEVALVPIPPESGGGTEIYFTLPG